MIGTSLSFCVQDILEKSMEEVDVLIGWRRAASKYPDVERVYEKRVLCLANVERVISATKADTEEEWERLVKRYSETYWSEFPEVGKVIADYWRERAILDQPRLRGSEPHVLHSTWVDRESLIQGPMHFPMDEQEVERWINL